MSFLRFPNIDSLGERCENCIGDGRGTCNTVLNATVVVQQVSTEMQAKGEGFTNDDPNLDWPRHELSQVGCLLTDVEKTELFATVCANPEAREYFRGVGGASIRLQD